mgnify:CR=1 FL=1
MTASSAKPAHSGHARSFPFLLGLLGVVLFFIVSGYVTYSSMVTLRNNSEGVARTHEVLMSCNIILSLMKDAETAQRGYVMSGEEEFLEPYTTALPLMENYIRKLQELTRDNPLQQERLTTLRSLAAARIDRLKRGIELRQTQGFEAARDRIVLGDGKDLMDRLREVATDIQQAERETRTRLAEETAASFKYAAMTVAASCAFGILLAALITWLLRRAAAQRRREEWFQTGQAGLAAAILGDLNLGQLGDAVLKYLAEYLGAHAGIFFARDESEYRRVATYGFPAGDSAQEVINRNDNLLGQAIKDGRSFVIEDVPDGYLRIGSGLGEAKPRHMVIAPAYADGATHAVFELGFVKNIDDRTMAFLDQASRAIGIAVQSANYRTHLQKLLEETQTQAEELQAQSEELRVANEELEEQSNTLKESQARLEQQQEELEVSNEELEEKTRALEEYNARIRQQAAELEETARELEEKARELELSGKYKSEFLANMSHELRTPLNSLLILAKNLAANEEGNLTEEQVEESNIIYNGGLELLDLINDILDLSKVEAGKISIITDDVAPRDIARRMEQQFAPVAAENNLPLHIEIAPDAPAAIHTDTQRVEQILKNLLSNAFKFTEHGSVTLRIGRPDASINLKRVAVASAQAVVFSVTDTGIGIDEAKLNSIFEAFQQEDGSTDRHYGGTGLGLTIARKFAHLMGGEIQVASKKGKGSTFSLILPEVWKPEAEKETSGSGTGAVDMRLPEIPARKAEPQRMEIKAMPKAPVREFIADDRDHIDKKDKVLLIIEDDRDFAYVLMKTAQKRGFKCLVAGDGKTGILLATEQPVSAVILDLRLPDIDGLNVLDQLKHDLRTRHIPVHIMTGFTDIDEWQPLRKGAIGVLSKPVSAEVIDGALGKIEDILDASVKKVLVIEDDKKSQTAIQSLLRKKDLEITCIGMGATALERVAQEPFDCIILDLLLPDMTGFEWLNAVAEKVDSDRLPPVIIYTAKELTEEENRKLSQYTGSIVIKGAHSSERLLDEVTLFLHSVESTLSKDQQAIIRMQHNPDKVLRDRTVLLVDDDLRNTFALSKMLKKHGMNVVIADNGKMALEKLAQHDNVELVIMDIMMPVMDGYEAMRAIRRNKKWEKLPMIALTARAMPEEQEKCMEAGANDYLTKPVDMERMLTLMRVWLFKQDDSV